MRRLLGIEDLLTEWHFDNLAKVVLLTSLVVSYSYITEAFMTWYAGDPIEQMTFHMRYFGPWGCAVLDNGVVQLRDTVVAIFPAHSGQPAGALGNHDFREYRNVVRALRDHRGLADGELRTFAVGPYRPSITEIMITVGSFAWFLGLFSLFSRFLPIFSMTELKEGIVWLRKALKMDRVKAA